MNATADLPEPDRAEGAPHPRETAALFGQDEAEAEFLAARASGRMHHGWLLTGPRGVGKATLAWRIARFLLATPEPEAGGLFAPEPPRSLDIPSDHPVARRCRALSEPRLFLLRRGPNVTGTALSNEIRVEQMRELKSFLNLSATDGGHRTVIVDAADEMNPSTSNALLKLLEEPPPRVTLLLVSHRPGQLLPTIRSRCRVLRLARLGISDMARALVAAGLEPGAPEDMAALAELSGGSVGEAIRIANLDGLELWHRIVALFGALPQIDRAAALALTDAAAARGAEARFDLMLGLIDLFLSRLARSGATGTPPPPAAPDEAALMARLCPGPAQARVWADLAQTLGARARRGRAVNLDPAALLMDMVLRIDATAGTLARH